MRAFGICLLAALMGCSGDGESQDYEPDTAAPPMGDAPSAPAPPASAVEEPPAAPEPLDAFFDDPDDMHILALAEAPIRRVRVGRGGRSLAFRIELVDGTKGYFKPEQTFSGAHWYSEIASYHLDRSLGFGRTAAVVGRRIPWRRLERAAEEHTRGSEAIIDDEGFVRGAFIMWIDGRLRPWRLGQDWEHFVRVEGGLDITPFQRPADYRARINGHALREETELGSMPDAPETLTTEEMAELSDLIVFDYLISNVDRWGGEYTNVRRVRGRLIYLDNGAGFWVNARLGLMESRLQAVQRFRRRTRDALERFDIGEYEARLASDPLAPVLPPSQLEGLAYRAREALAHIDAMIERFGEDSVFIE